MMYQAQLFPRITEAECDSIDIESLLYSGVHLEEVMHIQRPSLAQCLQFLTRYITNVISPEHVIFMSHNTSFAYEQLRAAYDRCGIPWIFASPIFEEQGEPGRGYIDTSDLIGLCNLPVSNRKLDTLVQHFRFDSVYTSEYLNSFFGSTFSLNSYFYQNQRWRPRTAIYDVLKICYVYQQIQATGARLPRPLHGIPTNS